MGRVEDARANLGLALADLLGADPKLDQLSPQVDATFKVAEDMIKFFVGEEKSGIWPLEFDNPLYAWTIGDRKQEVKNKIEDLLYGTDEAPGIKDFLVGAALPITLIDVAGVWRVSILKDLENAANNFGDTNLMGYWDGPAQLIYQNMRTDKQKPAFEAMKTYATTVASELETVGTTVESLYADLAKHVIDLVAAVATSMAKQYSVTGIVTFMSAYASTIIDLCKSASKGIVDILAATTKVSVNEGKLRSLIEVPTGMPNGHWPGATGQNVDPTNRNELLYSVNNFGVLDNSVLWKISTDGA
ncbi:hypothetical protein ACWDOP_11185 [Nocardia sp. NPDC003693]